MLTYRFHSSTETQAFGHSWGQTLPVNSVVCLFGDLAAGKTTLIKGIAAGVSGCSPDAVSSPTFVYLNIYSGTKTVYHFDLYRLNNSQEFISMGFDEYFEAGGVTCVEWPERLEGLLPPERIEIHLKHAGENIREIEIIEVKT